MCWTWLHESGRFAPAQIITLTQIWDKVSAADAREKFVSLVYKLSAGQTKSGAAVMV